MRMLEDVKISSRQLTIMTILYILGSAILIMPGPLATVAKRDAWIAAILAMMIGLLGIKLIHALGRRFPKLTLMAYTELLLGKWLGKVVILVFILAFPYLIACLTLYNIGDFLTTQMMPETPIEAIYVVIMIVVVAGARLGLETMARSSEIFFPWVLLLFGILVLFVVPNAKLDNILPVLEDGVKPVIRAALPFAGFPFMEGVITLMIYPMINRGENNGKSLIIGMLIGGFALIATTALCILVLGADQTARLTFPSYGLAKKISVGQFLERIEAVLAVIWMTTIVFRLTFLFYVSAVGIAHVFGLREYRFLLMPLAICNIVFALILVPNSAASYEVIPVWGAYAPFFGILFPLFLLILAKFRKKSCSRMDTDGNTVETK
ncbi:GerAB/ArcD/ProY family transporter [Brevibacillus nitrificans]|uniref:GerAB/ArcD/ProY family transporter n=1 Tax=Brevibacillus nitrificans TaxID=651560 RepID=UPI002606D7CC|nr:endospore germination permease [Brevibacillus nitrificans]